KSKNKIPEIKKALKKECEPIKKTNLEAALEKLKINKENFGKELKELKAETKGKNAEAKKKAEKTKDKLLLACRSALPDEAVAVMDALYILVGEKLEPKFMPVLGSGGNDGNLEFTNTFMHYLQLILPLNDAKQVLIYSRERLLAAVFNMDMAESLMVKGGVGQFFPGGTGGANSTSGFEGESMVNPWDFVLAIEGALLFAGSVAKRLDTKTVGKASFPFTVDVSAAGWSTISKEEADGGNRGELWLPLWKHPATYPEVAYLFSEGKAQVGRRKAANGVDFSRAIAGLGIDRGIDNFQRIGFLTGSRFGNMHLAVPLGLFPVKSRPEVNILNDRSLTTWLDQFRGICKDAPARLRQNLRKVEETIFDFCRYGGEHRLQTVVCALSRAGQAIALSKVFKKDKINIAPLMLSPKWIKALDDGTSEFRITAAVAAIGRDSTGIIGNVREDIEPVIWDKKTSRYQWAESDACIAPDVIRAFTTVLHKRMLEFTQNSLRELSLKSKVQAAPADIQRFLTGKLNEPRILELFNGLTLINWQTAKKEQLPNFKEQPGYRFCPEINRAYVLLKLIFFPDELKWQSELVYIRPEMTILNRLKSNNNNDMKLALQIAWRRLKASGLVPLINNKEVEKILVSPVEIRHLASALLIPISHQTKLAEIVIKK
ncbi:type I-U CRISPR-associated protein Csx17, partial [Peptococcaceae bacterium]|nr:type I-U CRISPR-associated protein Csx17 [Peptococcaceae bacterium]